ncbi:hypothetical protein CDL12_06841 [Handroanthus impetiginosus]|uniref:Uncharacterized protein n=1 Tax=Handroanthus impetiginosus TaxID=429701 RepID=A0A2G9HT32_9LAMI|nr:hypothetical protein CDL12_06841 [Handroanthus impetiginosus]
MADIFDRFKNEKGAFKESLVEDTKGLLELYEASFLMTEGEKTLELAREFVAKFLQKKLNENNVIDDYHALLVCDALDLPLHWRVERPKARWFIVQKQGGSLTYKKKRPDMNPIVLELAKMYNRWWRSTCIAEKLPFARDRITESYIWSVARHFEPQYAHHRITGTKVNAFITILDDIFDVYGSFEELQLFNDAIQRFDLVTETSLWLISKNYKIISSLNNLVDEIAYDILKDHGVVIIPYLRKLWVDLSQTYFQEAKWYYEGYKPTLQEYVENGWISILAPVILGHAFFLVADSIEKEAVQSLFKYHNMIRLVGVILRLANDLGTSVDEMERGDMWKSVQCYMNQTGDINKERVANSPFPYNFVRSAVNLGRTAQYLYHHGDGHGHKKCPKIKDDIRSLLFMPIA